MHAAPSPPTFDITDVGENHVNVTWEPSVTGNPGSVFYVQYRPRGEYGKGRGPGQRGNGGSRGNSPEVSQVPWSTEMNRLVTISRVWSSKGRWCRLPYVAGNGPLEGVTTCSIQQWISLILTCVCACVCACMCVACICVCAVQRPHDQCMHLCVRVCVCVCVCVCEREREREREQQTVRVSE